MPRSGGTARTRRRLASLLAAWIATILVIGVVATQRDGPGAEAPAIASAPRPTTVDEGPSTTSSTTTTDTTSTPTSRGDACPPRVADRCTLAQALADVPVRPSTFSHTADRELTVDGAVVEVVRVVEGESFLGLAVQSVLDAFDGWDGADDLVDRDPSDGTVTVFADLPLDRPSSWTLRHVADDAALEVELTVEPLPSGPDANVLDAAWRLTVRVTASPV